MSSAFRLVVLAAAIGCGPRSPTTPTLPEPASQPAQPAATPVVPLDELKAMKVSEIEIRGIESLARESVMAAISIDTGKLVDAAQLRRSLHAVMAIDGVLWVRALGQVAKGGGLTVIFEVTEAPLISTLRAEGNANVAEIKILRHGKLIVGERFDPIQAKEGARMIERNYATIGYPHAKVKVETSEDQGGVDVIYSVEEGPRVSISKIVFPGAKAITEARLLSLLTTVSPDSAVGGVYVKGAIEDASVYITSDYYEKGYINVRVGPHETRSPKRDAVEIVIPIVEGKQFRLGKISVKGALVGSARAYRAVVKAKRGQVFKRSAIQDDIRRLEKFHARQAAGTTPNVTPITSVDTDKQLIDLTFSIE